MFYSPILFSEIAEVNLTQFHNCNQINIDDLNAKENLIFYCLHLMSYLSLLLNILPNVKKPFIIISAMDDTEFPQEVRIDLINTITNNPFFKHWFTINKTIPNDDRFTSIPYGLDYWTLTKRPFFGENIQDFRSQNTALENVIQNTQHFTKRIPKIYANWQHHYTDDRYGGWRRRLQHIIPSEIIHYEPTVLKRTHCFEEMGKYAFVVSPYGNGIDCIRTFEALCLGCIVIMKRCCLDIVYEDLPVLFVNEWEDINETLLKNTMELYSTKKFNYEKLKMDYWIQIVRSKF